MNDAWLPSIAHGLARAAFSGGHRRFQQERNALEAVQRTQLASLLADVAAVDGRIDRHWRWEDFRACLPVTGWRDWQGLVDRQRATRERLLVDSPVMRYQPTSGSTSAVKWVPYTRRFLAELDAAIAPWLGDLYARVPGVRAGRHYWSLSWLPTSMRDGAHGELNDDMSLLGGGKRALVRLTQAVSPDAALATTSDGSLFVTLACLAADEQLSAISVWSPTFALGLLERLGQWRHEIADVLASGHWGDHAEGARHLRCPRNPRAAARLRAWDGVASPAFFRESWPRLALVSAWDTAAARPWASRLSELLPQAAFQGKGLWATEGVVTIPWRDRHLLAYRSHVYEFENLDDGNILAPWELRRGQQVAPVISTGSGLLRYRLNDVLRVEGHSGDVPAFTFIGRDDGTDLVGEKVSATLAQSLLAACPAAPGLLPVSLLALDDCGTGRPGYALLLEDLRESGARASVDTRALSRWLEAELATHFHYGLARNLGQLDAARVVCLPGVRAHYASACLQRGMVEGNIKVEPLRHWRGALPWPIAASLALAAGKNPAREVQPA